MRYVTRIGAKQSSAGSVTYTYRTEKSFDTTTKIIIAVRRMLAAQG
ncbi:MAG: hypothetical protein LBM98_13305 [Oscillospiraceae bacterium]|nr:hypothetical protein [Oscillospiraceae bacterium]